MKGLNDEIAEQDEVINRLNKEKKMVSEHSAKSSEDLLSAEEKVNHLLNIKKKLESTLDELESSYEKERHKKEIEGSIGRKEKDTSTLCSKLEDEQSGVARLQKIIKENQQRIEELEEELEAERQSRANAERQRSDLAREFEDLSERLEEAGGATAAQIELNKKRK